MTQDRLNLSLGCPHMRPLLFTFDVFGTLIDWRSGLQRDLTAVGVETTADTFAQIIAAQARLEQGDYLSYQEITARSLVEVTGLPMEQAQSIGGKVGHWPFYPDVKEALPRLMAIAPCVAMTNSDRLHGEQAQAQLGFLLSGWLCAQETKVYKPDLAFWQAVADRYRIPPGPAWWHVSAYADYDLQAASKLELTTVYIERPHAHPGAAVHQFRNLAELAASELTS